MLDLFQLAIFFYRDCCDADTKKTLYRAKIIQNCENNYLKLTDHPVGKMGNVAFLERPVRRKDGKRSVLTYRSSRQVADFPVKKIKDTT